ncbi:hypothetical protein ACA910_007007 [Epithemia clementina (nom. ined.)]
MEKKSPTNDIEEEQSTSTWQAIGFSSEIKCRLEVPRPSKESAPFEAVARQAGRTIKQYHSNNGIFAKEDWQQHCAEQQQENNFSGVGAHHQIGKAERTIRTIVNMARTMLFHAMIHWPDEGTVDLWPFAMEYAVHIWNTTPKKANGLSPEEIFFGTTSDRCDLQYLRVFGCPVYVLEPKLPDGKKLPKWQPRAWQGQFLGFLTSCATMVALVCSTRTGFISPQFHMVFDELFSTIYDNNHDYNVPDNRADLFTSSMISFLDGEDDLPPLPPDWTPPADPDPHHPNVVPVPVERKLPQNGQRQQQQQQQQPQQIANPVAPHQNNQIVDPVKPQPNRPLLQIVPPNDPPPLEPAPEPQFQQPQNPAPPANDQQPAAAPQPAAKPQGPRRNPPGAARSRPFRGRADPHSGLSAKVDPLEQLNDRFLACLPEEVRKTYQMELHSIINNALYNVDNEIQTGLHLLAFAAKSTLLTFQNTMKR